ncbi:MAG: ribonuclease P protein component [bacterium]|nr:ribonuclease P protein component [bacterium]
MLPLKNRLQTRKDFGEAKTKGQKYQSHLFGLLVYPTNSEATRFGFIVSTKISKKATQRNKVKRRLRESIKKILPTLKTGYDVVFLGKKELLDKKLSEISVEVINTFGKAGLLRRVEPEK